MDIIPKNLEQLNLLMENVCEQFCSDKSINKFAQCDLIAAFIREVHMESSEHILQSNWINKLRDELFVLYRNRLNDQLRSHVINLTAELTLKCKGLKWIQLGQWNEHNSKFFLLLSKLISIEIEMNLSECLHHIHQDDHNEWHYEKLSQNYGSCMVIYEHIFLTLIQNVDLEPNERIPLKPVEILSSIEYVNNTISNITGFLKEMASRQHLSSNTNLHEMALASIRLLSLYLCEETNANKQDFLAILPFIKKTLSNVKMSELYNIFDHYNNSN